ncbi:MAG TPA: RNA methyltransferase substrate-binding domain-containing protein, partial [Actinomycetota bacterium]|nr:RNA methyltransferase substrate-binding domain-containing protein [Actinomycetota bacterium]
MGGRRATLEAIRSGRARRVWAARGSHRTQGLRDVVEAAATASVPVEWVTRAALDELGIRDHQGVAAFVTPAGELD